MSDSFLSEMEQRYILDKAEFLKISALLKETVKKLEEDFEGARLTQVYKPGIPGEQGSEVLNLSLNLDNITSESFEKAVPGIKEHLDSYHRLRRCHRELEKKLYYTTEFNIGIDVINKTD